MSREARAMAKTWLKAAKVMEERGYVRGIRHKRAEAEYSHCFPDSKDAPVGAVCALGALDIATGENYLFGNGPHTTAAAQALVTTLQLPKMDRRVTPTAYGNGSPELRVADWSDHSSKETVVTGFRCAARRLLLGEGKGRGK